MFFYHTILISSWRIVLSYPGRPYSQDVLRASWELILAVLRTTDPY